MVEWQGLPLLWLQTLDRNSWPRHGQAPRAAGSLSMFQRGLPLPVHSDNTPPLHTTKLPLNTWLKTMWLLLQTDKGLSSIRLAETLVVSQPTAWRIGHALRLMVAREHMLNGTVEVDHFYLGGRPRKHPEDPSPG